jgi:hypothetical protein
MTTACTGFTDRRPGEPDGRGLPFFQTTLVRSGCGFATAGFPPVHCTQPVLYAATVAEFPEPLHLCAEHAARLRTTPRHRPTAMWSL